MAALAAVWLAWSLSDRLRGLPFLIAVLIAKLMLFAFVVPSGFAATYFANSEFAPPSERSLEYRGLDATRIDRRTSFGFDDGSDLPVHFLNDAQRFNFYLPGQPERSKLPVSVRWEGYAWEPDGDRARTFYARAIGGEATIQIDGAPALNIRSGQGYVTADVFYPAGWRHIVITLTVPYGAGRGFECGSIDKQSGAHRAFGDGPVYRAALISGALRRERWLRLGAFGVDALFTAWLVFVTIGSLVRTVQKIVAKPATADAMRAAFAIATAIVIGEAIWFATAAEDRVLLQPGGDDSLTYVTQARDIVLNGPLMLMGSQAGQAEPYYYQPLYGYFIATTHVIFGEDLFGLMFLQRFGLWITLLALWGTSRILFGNRVAAITLGAAGVFLYLVMVPWAATLWTETLFVPLLAVWVYSLIKNTGQAASVSTAAGSGAIGGLAILTRSTLLPALALVVPLSIIARVPRRLIGVSLGVLVLVISVATLRNWIASRTFVPITTSFAVNLYLGNTPPPSVPVHDTAAHAAYSWFAADDRTRMAVEFARHAPGLFAANLGRKALYALGVFEPLMPGSGYWPSLIGTWMAAVAGLTFALRDSVRRGAPWASRLMPGAVALSMFAVVVVIFPSHPRLIFPMYVLMLPYVAVAIAALGTRSELLT